VKKDLAAWSIPKGLIDKNEDALVTDPPGVSQRNRLYDIGVLYALIPVRLPSGKIVHAWQSKVTAMHRK